MTSRTGSIAVALLTLVAALAAVPARADFPWTPSGNPAPNEIDDGSWKFASTPEPGNTLINSDPTELFGVRGDSVADKHADAAHRTAWMVTTGRPDVIIDVLDSGIRWDDPGAMNDLRRKVHLNTGELPHPERADGSDCGTYDCDGNGVVNVDDYAHDPRINLSDPRRVGPPGVITPEDLIIAFSDGTDADGNGFVDDIAGWDFLDNDNDPYDDVHYGHGTGEARDSNAEANNGGDVGTCPNCMVVPLRVGDSFVADVNRFAQAAIYAADNGASVIQEALGTLNESAIARNAIDYAYEHGVTIIASSADEAAQHHNAPGSYAHVIEVNSVRKYDDTFTSARKSYLQINGCTNFMSKITVSVPSSSCSSEATGRSAGEAGLIYSEALQAGLPPNPTCTRTNGEPCVITPNEVRQLMASGTIAGVGGADDVNFAFQPEPSCTLARVPSCTDPNLDAPGNILLPSPLVTTRRYPARKGFDEFYGYGRLNTARSVAAVAAQRIPPEAEITSPDWYDQIDPAGGTLQVRGHVAAVRAPGGAYTCQLQVAPGAMPNNALVANGGDFAPVAGGWCDGRTARTTAYDGPLGTIDLPALEARFPSNVRSASAGAPFTGREPGLGVQTSNGRPNSEPYAFTVRVVVTAKAGPAASAPTATGEDRRALYLHRDADMRHAFPIQLPSDGAAAPLLADLDGDNRNELVVATSDGLVHAYRPNGSELPGWPVHGDRLPLHLGGRAFRTGEVPDSAYGAFLASPAIADLNHDGHPDVIEADLEGKVYGWDSAGHRVFEAEANPKFSGKPLAPFVNVRHGNGDRTQHGFIASPVVADLDGDGKPEIIAAGMDRHLYAWHGDGSPVAGFPVLLVDRTKVASIAPETDAVTFKDPNTPNQGAIVDTPAVGDINGDGKPEIVVGTNEEYVASTDGGLNAGLLTAATLNVLGQIPGLGDVVDFVNSRAYAVRANGTLLPGWPVKIGLLLKEVLPIVGEGIPAAPVIGPATCTDGQVGKPAVAIMGDGGPLYLMRANGVSCFGRDPLGHDNPLDVDIALGNGTKYDTPAFPALGHPAFGDLGGGPSVLAPVIGLIRALDIAAPEYQGGQDFLGAWDTLTAQQRPGWPTPVNDLQFLTGPTTADIDGKPGQEVLEGTASLDLQAFNVLGLPASPAWPKLTGDWTVTDPLVGSFSRRLDTNRRTRKTVVAITRSGLLQAYRTSAPACSPGSWPRYHHDNANSGDYARDAVLPGRPMRARVRRGRLSFLAPGDDLLCGRATRYETLAADAPIDGSESGWTTVGRVRPTTAGRRQSIPLRAGGHRYVAVRAVDDQGNVGRPAVVDLSRR